MNTFFARTIIIIALLVGLGTVYATRRQQIEINGKLRPLPAGTMVETGIPPLSIIESIKNMRPDCDELFKKSEIARLEAEKTANDLKTFQYSRSAAYGIAYQNCVARNSK